MGPMDRLTLAKELVRKAGENALGAFGKEFKMHNKPDGSLVTAIDEQCERIIIDGITKHFPNDAIVAEESGSKPGSSGYTWYIDPIDGTTNFGHRFPIFATSIGVTDPEGLSDAAINLPTLNWLFYGSRGKGAFKNDMRLAPSDMSNFDEAIFTISFPGAIERETHKEPKISELLTKRSRVRLLGSAVMNWALMASGATGAYLSMGLRAWDCAAGILISLEAGVVISNFEGERISYKIPLSAGARVSLCASAPKIQDEVIALAKTFLKL